MRTTGTMTPVAIAAVLFFFSGSEEGGSLVLELGVLVGVGVVIAGLGAGEGCDVLWANGIEDVVSDGVESVVCCKMLALPLPKQHLPVVVAFLRSAN